MSAAFLQGEIMSKVLYIGPYRQSDRWGRVSRDVIRSLDIVGADFMLRPISYIEANVDFSYPQEEKKVDYDVIVQHCLPSHFVYRSDVKNVFLYDPETSNIEGSNIFNTLKIADEVWCTNKKETRELFDDRIKYCDLSLGLSESIGRTEQEKSLELNLAGAKKVFYCNTTLENAQSIRMIKESFYIAFKARSDVKLILGVNSIDQGKQLLANNSDTLSSKESDNIILVTLGEDFRDTAMIEISDVVVSTPPYLNVNYVVAEALHQEKIVLTNERGFGSRYIDPEYLMEDYFDSCTIDVRGRGTSDFGNVNETVYYLTRTTLSSNMQKVLDPLYELNYKKNAFSNKGELYTTNIGDLL